MNDGHSIDASIGRSPSSGKSPGRSVGKSPSGRSKTPSRGKSAVKAPTRKGSTVLSPSTVQHRLETSLTDQIYEAAEDIPRRSTRLSRGTLPQ
jgi:hypothetical protein